MWCTKTNNYNSDKLKKDSPSYNAELNIKIWAQNQQCQCWLKTAMNVTYSMWFNNEKAACDFLKWK